MTRTIEGILAGAGWDGRRVRYEDGGKDKEKTKTTETETKRQAFEAFGHLHTVRRL